MLTISSGGGATSKKWALTSWTPLTALNAMGCTINTDSSTCRHELAPSFWNHRSYHCLLPMLYHFSRKDGLILRAWCPSPANRSVAQSRCLSNRSPNNSDALCACNYLQSHYRRSWNRFDYLWTRATPRLAPWWIHLHWPHYSRRKFSLCILSACETSWLDTWQEQYRRDSIDFPLRYVLPRSLETNANDSWKSYFKWVTQNNNEN